MLRTVPIFALAVTVSLAAVVLSTKRPTPSADAPRERPTGIDAWFV